MIRVWAGRSTYVNPQRDIDFCLEHGIGGIDLIVNDHSKWRKPSKFTARKPADVEKVARVAHDAGLEVHLMSWYMPHREYIVAASMLLSTLCEAAGAKSLQLDLEEPYTKAERPRLTYNDAASMTADLFADLPCELGINGIGYASVLKFGPMAGVASYLVPQCYSTRTAAYDPAKVVSRFCKRWQDKFQSHRTPTRHPLHGPRCVVGLAAYRQPPVLKSGRKHTVYSAMRASMEDAARWSSDVVMWWLPSIRGSKRIAAAIKKLSEEFHA